MERHEDCAHGWCARDISVDEPHRASRREVFARRRHTARAGSLSEVRQYAGAARDATTPHRGRALPGVSRFDAVDERRRIFLAMVALQNGPIVFVVDGLENDELGREFCLGHGSHPLGFERVSLFATSESVRFVTREYEFFG